MLIYKDNGSEVYHCQRKELQSQKGKKLEQTLGYWIEIGGIDVNSLFSTA